MGYARQHVDQCIFVQLPDGVQERVHTRRCVQIYMSRANDLLHRCGLLGSDRTLQTLWSGKTLQSTPIGLPHWCLDPIQ